ncbi:MAG: response regulator [Thermoanaerobaculia bacterium]
MRRSRDALHSRILIVDDQASNICLLQHILRRGGFLDVTSTTEPLTVAALHLQSHYDLIVLDLQMPLMNGFQVIEALDATPDSDHPAILVMSADPTREALVLAAGADGFLAKPYILADVLTRVHLLLDRHASPDHQLAPAA